MVSCAVRNRVVSEMHSDEDGFSSSNGQFPSEDFMDLDEFISASGLHEHFPENNTLDEENSSGSECCNGNVSNTSRARSRNSVDVDEVDSSESTDTSINQNISNDVSKDMSKTETDLGETSKTRKRRSSDTGYVYKPAPIFKKSKRNFIPNDSKDDKYWERRNKNNVAAKRSRDMRREKEIEIAEMCKNLEDENTQLKEEILKLEAKARELEQKVASKASKEST